MLQRVSNGRQKSTRDAAFPAPSMGWVQSGNITTAPANQAEVLDNFRPTAQGAEIRGGSSEYADLGASVRRLMVYSSGGDTLFGATANGIFDADRINAGGDAFADVTGLGSGDWSAVQTATSAGQFLFAVNGTDLAMYFSGTAFNPINGAAVNDVTYDALTAGFVVGETVTGGTSGASATILAIIQTATAAGVLKVGAITSGPFQNNEALTSATGAATADGASASASAITITGVATSALSQVWLFSERIFAIEGGTMSAWYLPVKSIGGAATEIPLGALFPKGGSLLFGATWSLDSGSGLDDVCLFFTTEGQVAVYQGTDPSSTATWALVGVYEIAKPLNKHAAFKAGGDLAVLTEDGIIPISAAISKDRAGLQGDAITLRIEDAWRQAVANRTTDFPISATLWQSQTQLIVGIPVGIDGLYQAAVSNARTGAWSRYTGWDIRCSAISNNAFYFGNSDGQVMQGETGGNDDGVAYSAVYVPKFQEFGAGVGVATAACITYRAAEDVSFSVKGFSDYKITDIPPSAPLIADESSVWGTGVWGTFVWGGGADRVPGLKWKTISAIGNSLSFGFKATINQATTPQFEVLASRIRYETASPL